MPLEAFASSAPLTFGVELELQLVSLSDFDLTPASQRPYAGSTQGNSMIELALQHNGLERFVHLRRSRPVAPPLDGSGLGRSERPRCTLAPGGRRRQT